MCRKGDAQRKSEENILHSLLSAVDEGEGF
jgi:hypothetical protein